MVKKGIFLTAPGLVQNQIGRSIDWMVETLKSTGAKLQPEKFNEHARDTEQLFFLLLFVYSSTQVMCYAG